MKTDLIEIFQTIRAQLQPYVVEGFKIKTNSESAFHLIKDEDVNNIETNVNEIYFFGIEIKENYVGLYFRDIYTESEMNLIFTDELLKLLKDKNCIQISILDDLMITQISNTFKAAFIFYKQKGWV